MRAILALTVAAALAMTAACDDSPSSPSGLNSTLNVRITDSPYSDAKALLVTFSEVSAHKAAGIGDGEWLTLTFAGAAPTRTCDLKKLVGAQDVLGVGTLSEGRYTQIRLTVTDASLYFDTASDGPACAPTMAAPAGRSAPVTVSSGEVKLNRTFELTANNATTILVDFDGDRSVIQTGSSYRMSPVIGIVSVQ